MSGITKITKGMISPLGGADITVIKKIIYPITATISKKSLKINVLPITKNIHLNILRSQNE